MPLYEYVCNKCGTNFEAIRGFTDASTPACPHGHRKARKIVSAPAVVFKGSGWYVTDSRTSERGSPGAADQA